MIDEDDRVIVPAPSADVFLGHRSATRGRPARSRLSVRRTFIPILLTAGFILAGLGTLRFTWTVDSPLAGLAPWLIGVMFLLALVLWALAVLNMLAVKHQLTAQDDSPARK